MAKAIDLRDPRDWVEILPDFVRLLWRTVRDDRVSPWVRGGLVGVAAYLVFPIDLVPDWIPFAGQVDDIIVLTVGVPSLLRRVPQDILFEHWSGDPEVLERLMGRELETGPTRT